MRQFARVLIVLVILGLAAGSAMAATIDTTGGVTLSTNDPANTYTGSGTLTVNSGVTGGIIQLASGSGTGKTYFNMTGGLIDIVGPGLTGTWLRNGGWSAGVWTSNLASMQVDGVLDMWNGNTVYVNALTGSGYVSVGQVAAEYITVGVNNGSGTFNGTLQDGNGGLYLTKNGTGIEILNGTNTNGTGAVARPTTINAGTLEFAKRVSFDNNLPAKWVAADITVQSGATLAVGVGANASGYFDTGDLGTLLDGSHLGASTATTGLKSGAILGLDTTNASGGVFTYGSAIGNPNSGANTLGLTKLGTGTLTLTATNTFTGSTTVSAGTLQLGNGTTNGSVAGSIADNSTLLFNNATLQTSNNAISGTGMLAKLGAGNLVLSNTIGDSGGTTVVSGLLSVTGSLTYGDSGHVWVYKDADGILGDGTGDAKLVRHVTAASSYAGLGSAVWGLAAGELQSTADIKAGTASTDADVGMAWRTRTAAEKTQAGGGLISEVLGLDGISANGGGTDNFLLQMSYDTASLSTIWGLSETDAIAQEKLELGSLAGSTWVNAVSGNVGGTPTWMGDMSVSSVAAGDPSAELGWYGVDTSNGGHLAWAVLDHNTQFAVLGVPEPGTLALLAAGLVGLLAYAWRKRK